MSWLGPDGLVESGKRRAVEVRYFPARRGKEVNAGPSRNGTARLVGLSQGKAVEVQAGWVCVRHGGFRQRMAVKDGM